MRRLFLAQEGVRPACTNGCDSAEREHGRELALCWSSPGAPSSPYSGVGHDDTAPTRGVACALLCGVAKSVSFSRLLTYYLLLTAHGVEGAGAGPRSGPALRSFGFPEKVDRVTLSISLGLGSKPNLRPRITPSAPSVAPGPSSRSRLPATPAKRVSRASR